MPQMRHFYSDLMDLSWYVFRIIIYKIIPLNAKVTTSQIIIWIDFKYIPYSIQNTNPVQYIMYIDKDNPETFLVTIDLIAWGIKETIVHIPQM